MRRRADSLWFALLGAVLLLAALRLAAFRIDAVERADQLVFAGFAGFHRPRGAYDAATLLAGVCAPVPFLCLAAVPMLIAAVRARWSVVAAVLALLAGANLTTELLKRLLAAPRFSEVPGGRVPSPTAWPSGHATAAASLVLACVIVSPSGWRPRVAAAGTAFFLAMGYAFMTLRWHYETDVIGGLVVATSWGLIAIGMLGRRRAESALATVMPLVGLATVTWVLLVVLAWPHLLRYTDSRTAFVAATGLLAVCSVAAVGSVARACGRPTLGRDLASATGHARTPSRRRQPPEAEQLPS